MYAAKERWERDALEILTKHEDYCAFASMVEQMKQAGYNLDGVRKGVDRYISSIVDGVKNDEITTKVLEIKGYLLGICCEEMDDAIRHN